MKSNQTFAEAVEIQNSQLAEWETVLKTEHFLRIKFKIGLENSKYSEHADSDLVMLGKNLDLIFTNYVQMVGHYMEDSDFDNDMIKLSHKLDMFINSIVGFAFPKYKKDYSKFTVEKGIEIQTEQLKRWKVVLEDEHYSKVYNYSMCENASLCETDTGYNVFRGQDIDNYVRDLASDTYKEIVNC